jgi:acetyltransferase-like isoleucine patch superfamily enzyme/capsular polysaccharide biosynthesis protein
MTSFLVECTECWGNIELIEDPPLLSVDHNVIYVPYEKDGPWGLFRPDGDVVPGSVDFHGPDREVQGQILSWSGNAAHVADDGNYLYGGLLNPHFGHFLVNSLSRLWPLVSAERPAAKIVFHGLGDSQQWFNLPFCRDIFEALGLQPSDVLILEQPTMFKNITVPHTSFQEQHFIHRAYAQLGHHIGQEILKGRPIRQGLPAVYLSKTRLPSGVGHVENEDIVESILREAGSIEILYPETLCLREQIALFAERPVVVGTTGSAFHTSIFYPPKAKLILLSPVSGPNTNFMMIDLANENDARYVYAPGTTLEAEDGRFLTTMRFPEPEAIAHDLLDMMAQAGANHALICSDLFLLETCHRSLLAIRRSDNVIVHTSNGADPELFAPLYIWRPGALTDTCLLCSTREINQIHLSGDKSDRAVLSYRCEMSADRKIILKHPSTGQFISAVEGLDEFGVGAVSVSSDQAHAWEIFAPIPAGAEIPSPILSELMPQFSRYADRIDDMEFASLSVDAVANLFRLLQSNSYQKISQILRQRPDYNEIFPYLRSHISKQAPLLWGQTTDVALEFWIENCGYKIGRHTYGSPKIWSGLLTKDATHLTIGKYCAIAGEINIVVANHQVRFGSIYPFAIYREFWPGGWSDISDHVAKPVIVGNDVWIGINVCLLPGTILGDGAVIGANAVVRGEIPPYAIVAGNPGNIVGYRFPADIVQRLLKLKWWDWPDWKVDQYLPLIMSENIVELLDVAERDGAAD